MALALGCVLAAPWYVRNGTLYHSLLGMPLGSTAISALDLSGFLRGTARSFWYPMRNLPEGTVLRQAVTLAGTVLLALHVTLAAWWLARRDARNAVTWAIVTAFVLAVSGYTWYLAEWRNAEARLLLPVLGSIVFLIVAPVQAALARVKRARLVLAYVALLALWPYAVVPLAP